MWPSSVAFRQSFTCRISFPGLLWAVSFWMCSASTARSTWYSLLLEWSPSLFFRISKLFRTLAIGTDVWKEFGFNAVVYLAALTGISPSLYEAAAIDGAGRWSRMWHITLPGLKPVIVLMTILALGNILNAGFDQIYNIYNQAVYSTGDIIDTWVYRVGLNDLQFSLATAVGLLKSVIGFLMISLSYLIAYKKANYRIF